MFKRLFFSAVLGTLALTPSPLRAWTEPMRQVIAAEAARLAPRDLARQIRRHHEIFELAVQGADLDKTGTGKLPLPRAIDQHVAEAIAAIRSHQPFEEIVRRLGAVTSEVAYASSPFSGSNDPQAARYSADYLEYAESAESRFPLVFYGIEAGIEAGLDADRRVGISSGGSSGRGRQILGPAKPPPLVSLGKLLIEPALLRAAQVAPMIAREYQRIGNVSGTGVFDDRSTAFGIASTSFSHAVTDAMTVLRYIWLQAGGSDSRSDLPASGSQIVLVPRGYRAR